MFNFHCHKTLIVSELKKILMPSSYVTKAWRVIGAEINATFEEPGEDEIPTPYRPNELALWAQQSGGFDVEWLSESKGNYICDDGTFFQTSKKLRLTPAEQLAAYGLWFIDDEMNSHGEIDYVDRFTNANGILVTDVIFHRAECIMAAYQCLRFAENTVDPHSKHDYSKYAKRGSARKEVKRQEVKSYVLEQYKSGGPWQSKRHAAFHIWKGTVDFSKSINYPLTETGAETTVYKWIREGTKNVNSQG